MRILVIVLISSILFVLFYSLFLDNKNINVLNSRIINRGVGWENNESYYSGSEFNFSFNGSRRIDFRFSTNSKSDQGVEILLDGERYAISSPNLNKQMLSINVDKKTSHTVTLRHFCIFFYDPCLVKIEGIYLERGSKLWPYQLHNKTLSVLGDSISTIYGKDNYSQVLADDLGYELHNASIIESTVSEVSGVDNAIRRYKKDLMSFNSDAIIILLGTNDAARNVPLDTFEKNYSKIVFDVKKFNPSGRIFLVGILRRKDLDSNVLELYNETVKKTAEKHNVYFIDSSSWLNENDFSDGIHPSLESQRKLADYFKDSLSSILK